MAWRVGRPLVVGSVAPVPKSLNLANGNIGGFVFWHQIFFSCWPVWTGPTVIGNPTDSPFVGWWQRLSKNWYLHDICRSLGTAKRLPETLAGLHQMGYTAPRPQGGNQPAISCFLPASPIHRDFHRQVGLFGHISDFGRNLGAVLVIYCLLDWLSIGKRI